MPETRKYTVADLFAGVGGLSYGFSRNDRFEIILANEMQKDIALWHARNDNPQMRVRHILEYIENGEMVGKDVLEYDASTDKWHRIEAESIELV